MATKPFEQMTKEEKEEAFKKWSDSRDTRKGNSTIKKGADKALQTKYAKEFEGLKGKVKPTVKTYDPALLTQAEKAAKYDALYTKKATKGTASSVKKGAVKALRAAHQEEYDKLTSGITKKAAK